MGTILTPIESQTTINDGINAYNKYASCNYNYIDIITTVGDMYFIKKVKSVLSHFNYCHCGVEVLSMNKRIMNEIMCSTEDLNLSIDYQDTDSMHTNYDEVAIFAKETNLQYQRELIGKHMPQFRVDFEMDGANDELYATECFFLG